MSVDRDSMIDEFIAELPGLVFTTRDPVINYLAPTALEKLARLRTSLRNGQYATATELVERELGPTLEKLEEVLGELVQRRVAPFEALPAVNRVMGLCREFLEVYRPELQRSVAHR
jgi:hypothetical protein